MGIALQTSPFFLGIEYLAIFFAGMAGGLAAIRRHYDVFTIVVIAWLTALGGGIIRDVLLGSIPPIGISDRISVLTALFSGAVVAVLHPEVEKLRWSMIVIDALGLGLFAVNGASKALMYNTTGMTAVFLGTFTAIGGGVIRDMLLNEVPVMIRDRHWYIVPAVLGSMFTVFTWRWRARGIIDERMEFMLNVAIVVFVVLMRLASVKFNLLLPGALPRTKPLIPSRILVKTQVLHRGKTHTHDDSKHNDDSAENINNAQ